MKNSFKMILVLVVVSLLSSVGLSFVYKYAQPQIAANKQKELNSAILKVLPHAKSYDTITKGDEKFYIGKDARKRLAGYAVVAKGGGYQGEIVIMAGLDSKLEKILAIEILESVETPGLGGMIKEDDFKNQFKSLSILPEISMVKEETRFPNEIQAITGATVSSKAVVRILNEKIQKIKRLLKK